jgi:hypothetical protein
VGRDHVQIAELRQALREGATLDTSITDALDEASAGLRRLVAGADGLQLGGRPEAWSHHLANVLFNCMRGGVFTENHELPVDDFRDFLAVRNREVLARQVERLAGWPATMTVGQLFAAADETRDADLQRLAREYLPLSFGRRHGDPSRPWNRFEIRVRDRNGGRALHYEGNWRDVFQNWEALATAFPGFLPSFVAKFVNASTVDGFNPYRITRDGVDWETVSPDDPWSNIGYWGDHQIVYLLKLLEALQQHDPDALDGMLGAEIFSYAEVPYRIKPYAELLRDPGATIVFDTERAARIEARCARIGSDGKLLHDADGTIRRANLLEKLLVPALSKLSNLVPDGGIWMNTQRPEWNDANNALAGGGISVVTLCYLRRYLAFLAELLTRHPDRELPVAAEVVDWFDLVSSTLESERSLLGWDRLDELDRRRLLDMLGGDFSAYRDTVYAHGFSSRRDLGTHQVAALCRTALAWVDHGIAANRRQDGLYHAYNLLQLDDEGRGIRIGRLPVMLEGQVAVLSSGAIDPAESLAVLEHLFASDLYRPDQRSFMLYPERRLPGFLERNTVPAEGVAAVPLLQDLLAAGDPSLLARDRDGVHRFHGDLRNREDLAEALDRLARDRRWRDAVERDRAAVLALFEEVFQHASYTGRSGVMYGYEGLGCIYWHMVAKLLLAAQENVLRAERDEAPPPVREGLVGMYYRIRAGIGYERTVVEYGAFPTDPYSHTPPDGGARQPGMTGQVKEEILTRLGELGVRVDGGLVRFAPTLLEGREFLAEPADFDFFDLSGSERSIALDAGSLAFTLCQTPVVYRRGEGEAAIRVVRDDGTVSNHAGDTLDATTSMQLFAREGRLDRIEVTVPASALRDR